MKKLILLLFTTVAFLASTSLKEYTIGGTVIDDLGEPLFDARIIVKGTTTETKTDFDGKFSIQSSDSCTVVVVEYRGGPPMEVKLCAGSENKFVYEQGKKLESLVIKNRVIRGADIKNLPTRNIGSIATTTYCFAFFDNREDILKVKESNADATIYFVDGERVSKVEALAIPEEIIRFVSIIERGSTPSTMDTYNEKDLFNRIESIRKKAQLNQ